MSKKIRQLSISELILSSPNTREELQNLFNRNDIQKSFILSAIRNGNLAFLQELKEAKYDLNIYQNNGIFKSAMSEALHSNNLEVVKFIHESNVLIDHETLSNAFWYKCKLDIILYIRDKLSINQPEYFINLCKEHTPHYLNEYVKKYETL